MKKNVDDSQDFSSLRREAEHRLSKVNAAKSEYLSEFDTLKLLHEYDIFEEVLNIQNEELQIALEKAEIATELYDFAPAGYFTLDRNATVIQLNLSAAKLLGKDRYELLGSNLASLVDPDFCGGFNDFFNKIIETKSRQTCHVKFINKSVPDTFIYLEGSVSNKRNSYLITAVDITDRIVAEEKLKESESRLQELNATKDKFFTIIAHDLKNPFNSILGFSNILAEQIREKDYEGIERYSVIIQDSAARAMDLLSNLMEWSRAQTGILAFKPDYFLIGSLIDEVKVLLKDAAQQKSITIYSEDPHRATVFADKPMLGAILRNLVSNSVKFSNPNGKIVVSVVQKPDELLVTVSDNGVGIRKENIGNLFRIDSNKSTLGTHHEKGTGLGLILCAEFIRKHGGQIWVESEVGQGATFFFTIPKVNGLRI